MDDELSTEKISEDDKQKQQEIENGNIKIAAGYAVEESVCKSTQALKVKFAKPETYTGNRMLYDSGKAKVAAKKELFADGAKVRDPYTGEKLVLTKKEAKMSYGEEWSKHLAESDHVKPLEQIYKDTKNNVWNTTEDIKNAANSKENIRVASRKFNNPKRSRTNKEYVENKEYLQSKGVNITEKGKKQALVDGELAEESIRKSLHKASAANQIKAFNEGGKVSACNAGGTVLTMSGIMNMVSVIKGEKDSEQAIKDTLKDGGKAAISGYVMGGGITVISHTLSESSSKFIQELTKANVPAKIITAITVTGDVLKKWGNGEITTQECLIGLGDKGLNMATMGYSMAVGQALIPIPIVGGAVGALVGSMLTGSYYNQLINRLQKKELEHQERLRLIAECQKATEQIKRFRTELESYLENYLKDLSDCFNVALSSLQLSYQLEDADGVIAGANDISRKLGGIIQYETVEEFHSFLDDNSVDNF